MIGGTLGSYTIQRELGRGGMGAVFIGAHSLLGRQAAVKVLLPELSRNQTVVQRFFNEARAATAVKHPGIVEIYDFGFAADGSAYIVMELLQGETLSDRLARVGRLPAAVAVQIARQTAVALGAAHHAGIVHRDLKPDNIFLVPDAETALGERVKLLDFGIAKLTDESQVSLARTSAGTVMGTPYYMAPEQCLGLPNLDHRADLYALGCVLFEMTCGRPPFTGNAAGAVLAAHINTPPTPPRALVPELPAELEALVLRLMAKEPAQRPASAEALASELGVVGQHLGVTPSAMLAAVSGSASWSAAAPVTGAPLTTLGGAAGQGASTMRTRRRAPWLAVVVGVAVAALGAGAATMAVEGDAPVVAAAPPKPDTGPFAPEPVDAGAAAPRPESKPIAQAVPPAVQAPAPSPRAVHRPAPPKNRTIRMLIAAHTRVPECDRFLHLFGRYLQCPGVPESATDFDVDSMINGYGSLNNPHVSEESRRTVVQTCVDGMENLTNAMRSTGCKR